MPHPSNNDLYPGSEITGERWDFLRAMQRLKRRHPHPTWSQVYDAVKALGYRLTGEGEGRGGAESPAPAPHPGEED